MFRVLDRAVGSEGSRGVIGRFHETSKRPLTIEFCSRRMTRVITIPLFEVQRGSAMTTTNHNTFSHRGDGAFERRRMKMLRISVPNSLVAEFDSQ